MNIKDKKFLVIGGGGFIGSHVVDALLKEDVKEVRVYDNFSRGSLGNLKAAMRDKRLRIIKGDILHRDCLEETMAGINGVFHLAAVWLLHCLAYPETAFEVNIRGTFNVIMAAIKRKVERVVFSSSASVYGDALEIPITEEHPYNNETFYGATKIAAEQMFKSLGKSYGLNWVGLRYMNVYGPRQDYKGAYTAVIHKIIDRLEKKRNPILYGSGSQEYDFVYVGDVAQANIFAMKSEASGKNYNVGTGIGTSLKELAEIIIKLYGIKASIGYKPAGLSFVAKRIGATKMAEKDLGFRWKTDLKAGLEKLIKWRKTQIEVK